jgi:hypothetical protein
MIDPNESDIGRAVIYRDLGGKGKIEEGRITSFNDRYVFVRYNGHTSAATSRADLEWSHRRPSETAIATVMKNVGGKFKAVSIDFCDPPVSDESP